MPSTRARPVTMPRAFASGRNGAEHRLEVERLEVEHEVAGRACLPPQVPDAATEPAFDRMCARSTTTRPSGSRRSRNGPSVSSASASPTSHDARSTVTAQASPPALDAAGELEQRVAAGRAQALDQDRVAVERQRRGHRVRARAADPGVLPRHGQPALGRAAEHAVELDGRALHRRALDHQLPHARPPRRARRARGSRVSRASSTSMRPEGGRVTPSERHVASDNRAASIPDAVTARSRAPGRIVPAAPTSPPPNTARASIVCTCPAIAQRPSRSVDARTRASVPAHRHRALDARACRRRCGSRPRGRTDRARAWATAAAAWRDRARGRGRDRPAALASGVEIEAPLECRRAPAQGRVRQREPAAAQLPSKLVAAARRATARRSARPRARPNRRARSTRCCPASPPGSSSVFWPVHSARRLHVNSPTSTRPRARRPA